MTGILDGRIAVITGASRGIGAAVAPRFASAGAEVVLVARTVGGLEEVDDEIRAAGGKAATLGPLDMTDFPAIDRLGGVIAERHGRRDILVGKLAVAHVVIGHDFKFGQGRAGTAERLDDLAREYGFGYSQVQAVGTDEAPFASTAVRAA